MSTTTPVRARPLVHFTAPSGWLNDPYGIGWDGSRYHLFYQAVPDRLSWAPECRWGHAVSPDLVRWTAVEPALVPQDFEVGCWSGSAVFAEGRPTTLFYTRVAGSDWGQGQIAVAQGDAANRHWHSARTDVVIAHPPAGLSVRAFRDPFVWRAADGWVMVVGAGLADGSGVVVQYRSDDLRDWRYDGLACVASDSDGAPWTGALWECPQLVQLGADWLLIVSVWDSDALYWVAGAIGDYDGRTFTPRRWQRLSYGRCAYAMTSFVDRESAHCVMSWLREEPLTDADPVGFAGAHSVAALITTEQDRVVLRPHPDLLAVARPSDVEVTGGRFVMPGDSAQLITIGVAAESSLALIGPAGTRARLAFSTRDATITVERPSTDAEVMPLDASEPVYLLLDADIMEIFGAGGYGAFRIAPADATGVSTIEVAGLPAGALQVARLDPSRSAAG